MGEFKFRAWDKAEKRFYYFTLQEILERKCHYQGGFDFRMVKADKTQYTGLKDINNKEIYEGDIVKVFDVSTGINSEGYVTFGNGCFYITDGEYSRYRWVDYQVEVIGNIYENPELWEEN